jgi:hypothetical protein
MILRMSSIWNKIEVVFHLNKNAGHPIWSKMEKQAGAELCQAQVKLGLDWLSCKLFLIWYLELTLANINHSEIFDIS